MVPEDLIEKKLAEASSLEEIAEVLKLLLGGGFSVWEDGSLYFIRQLVGSGSGVRKRQKMGPGSINVVSDEENRLKFSST